MTHLISSEIHSPSVLRQLGEVVEPLPHAVHLHRVHSLGPAGNLTFLEVSEQAGAVVSEWALGLHVELVVVEQQGERAALVGVRVPATSRQRQIENILARRQPQKQFWRARPSVV